jgi:hypothetical protein
MGLTNVKYLPPPLVMLANRLTSSSETDENAVMKKNALFP